MRELDVIYDDGAAYKTGHPAIPVYEFPFTLLDPTPGGANLGRIAWCVELHPTARARKGVRRIAEVWVWARQTRDPRYVGRIFKFPTNAESLGVDALRKSYHPWRIRFCGEHRGALVLEAYPANEHTKLVVSPCSAIQCEVNFR